MAYSIQYRLDGQIIDSPVERFETKINVDFEDGAQGSVEVSPLTFVNNSYKIIQNRIKSGANGGIGITEGMDLECFIQEVLESLKVLDSYLDFRTLEDLTGDPNHVNEPKVICNIVEKEGLNNLSTQLEGLTFAYLESVGQITKADYQTVFYLVEKKVTFLEQAFLGLAIYSLLKEIYESSLRLADQIATISSITSSSPSGGIGGTIYAIASAVFLGVYIGLMVKAVLQLIKQFKENIIPSVQTTFGINYFVALEKIFSFLGYEFITGIDDLKDSVYLPSKADGRQDKGTPFDGDFGFLAQEFVSLCLDTFKAEIFISTENGKSTVRMLTKKDPFFQQQSTYILPSVIDKAFSYNIEDIKESTYIKFATDTADEYTVSNWKGTSVVVITTQKNKTDPKKNLLKGFKEVRLPIALATRKEQLSTLETSLNSFLEVANSLFSVFGVSNSETPIQARIGMMIISQPFFSVPKMLKMKGSKLDSNYRNVVSAKNIWEKYHSYDSFVTNEKRQRKVYSNIRIPFSFSDYKKITKNSYFTTAEGQKGKFTSLEWIVEGDYAEASFWIEEVYTKNLKEEVIEAQ